MDIFYQFEQPSQKFQNNVSINAEMSTSGYIQMSMEPEMPIFSKSKKDFSPADKITHVAISNKYLVVAMANNVLFRMNLSQPTQQDEISLTKYTTTGKLTNLFLDPYGNHMLLTFSPKNKDMSPELLYLSKKSNKLKQSVKFRGHEFTQVAWNYGNDSENNTGPILLGTSKGLIIETEITMDGEKFFSSSLEQYWRQLPNYLPLYGNREIEGLVYDIGKGNNIPITGLEYFNVPGQDKFIIFVSTPSDLYYFLGTANLEVKPLLHQVFNKYLNIREAETVLKHIDGECKFSKLQFWSENLIVPNSLAWLTNRGIYYAQFDPLHTDFKDPKQFNLELIEYPRASYAKKGAAVQHPFALTLTEFHVLVAYTDTIKGICLLNEELIYEDNYNEAFGSLVDVVKDHMTGTIWAVTEETLFRFKVTKEERRVWQIYCDKKQFELAKRYAEGNEAYYNQVLIKEANMLFDTKQYALSASRYAETQSTFEEICLKFIQVDKQDALKIFLRKKLMNLKNTDRTQTTLIVLWLIELYLNEIEELRLQQKDHTNEYYDLQNEFEKFLILPEVFTTISKNKASIYDLMASHGDKINTIKLTVATKDFEKLIRQHIYKNSFCDALEVLKSQNNLELYYHFTPILIQEVPKHMVRALIDQGRNLQPVKLLPALVGCDTQLHALEIIKYLEFCVVKMRSAEKAIHNLLLSLYAKYDEKKLMEYLNGQGQDILMVNYDVYFALRICQERKLTAACVQLCSLLGLWETAIEMALTIDTKLAIQIANQPTQSDVELRKKLWLKIAKHVVSGKDDVQTAMEFLQQCDLIKIEDILPFFSDFVTLEHFKDAICDSLKEYNQHIEDVKEEMEEATKSAELVRKEIQSFRNKCTLIKSSDMCEICELPLMIRPFYMFPCCHRFHSDCLLRELNPMLGPAKRNKLTDLQRQLNMLSAQTIDNVSTGSTGLSAKDTVKAEIDNIVASECLYCGENMIRNIDAPFFHDNEYEAILREWD